MAGHWPSARPKSSAQHSRPPIHPRLSLPITPLPLLAHPNAPAQPTPPPAHGCGQPERQQLDSTLSPSSLCSSSNSLYMLLAACLLVHLSLLLHIPLAWPQQAGASTRPSDPTPSPHSCSSSHSHIWKTASQLKSLHSHCCLYLCPSPYLPLSLLPSYPLLLAFLPSTLH
ncbi:hypothetical protein OH77DRAFT_1429060 [Trametes cingulata]|nr:hypothetical protein OH77DRAFT_1429060 [Trametes cingulata]